MRILLVEDDKLLCSVVARTLREGGYVVDTASTLGDAQHLWLVQTYDAVLLDLNLPLDNRPASPLGSGLVALRAARARGDQTPVLVLTARNRTDERIAGLDAGADDYLGKPFELHEVEARLRALMRRSQGTNDQFVLGRLSVNRKTRRMFVGDAPLELPAREQAVLWELISPPGRVVSKLELSAKLSGFDEALGDNALEAFVSRLRKKLDGSGVSIRTLRGLGYLVETVAAQAVVSGN